MSKKLVLLSILVACVVTLGTLLFINKDRILTLPKPTPTNLNKLTITQDELAQSLELERLLQTANESQATATLSSKDKLLQNRFLGEAAKERVTRRKILETEGQKLGVDVAQVKKDSLPVLVTREGIKLTATASATLYSYDEDLQKAVKEKVEGYVEKQVLSVIFQSAKVATVAQKIADDVLTLMQKDYFNLQKYLKDHSLDKSLSLFDRTVRDPLKAYPDATKIPTPGQINIESTPFSYDIVKTNKIEKGLGVSFEEWYKKVTVKYL